MIRSVELKKEAVSPLDTGNGSSLDVTVARNGDLVFRCLNRTFTMARDSLKSAPAVLEEVHRWKMQVVPDQAGVTVKVAYHF